MVIDEVFEQISENIKLGKPYIPYNVFWIGHIHLGTSVINQCVNAVFKVHFMGICYVGILSWVRIWSGRYVVEDVECYVV